MLGGDDWATTNYTRHSKIQNFKKKLILKTQSPQDHGNMYLNSKWIFITGSDFKFKKA